MSVFNFNQWELRLSRKTKMETWIVLANPCLHILDSGQFNNYVISKWSVKRSIFWSIQHLKSVKPENDRVNKRPVVLTITDKAFYITRWCHFLDRDPLLLLCNADYLETVQHLQKSVWYKSWPCRQHRLNWIDQELYCHGCCLAVASLSRCLFDHFYKLWISNKSVMVSQQRCDDISYRPSRPS